MYVLISPCEIEINFSGRFFQVHLPFWICITLPVTFTHSAPRWFHSKINLNRLVRQSFYPATLIRIPIYCLRVRWRGVYGVFYCFKTINKTMRPVPMWRYVVRKRLCPCNEIYNLTCKPIIVKNSFLLGSDSLSVTPFRCQYLGRNYITIT